ncbi:MAG: hypothetical protein M3R38_01640 [Actinomycetota bacterium]|nr:hypothetical protein [Actinomycetota bacterium]
MFARLRRLARQEELEALKSRLAPDTDYKALAENYFEQLVRRDRELEELDAEITDLRGQVSNLQLARRWKDEMPNTVEPDVETPPETVEEAVLAAINGMESVETVAGDAGPRTRSCATCGCLPTSHGRGGRARSERLPSKGWRTWA